MNFVLIGVVLLIVVGLVLLLVGSDDSASPSSAPAETPVQDAEENPNGEGEEEQEQEQVEAKEEVSKDAPSDDPKKIPGCVGWFTGESWDAKKGEWTDLSEAGNNVTDIEGEPEVTSDDSSNNQKYLFGGPSTKMKFPVACMSTGRKYTMISVARYGKGASHRRRIFDGSTGTFFSGFNSGHVGTAYRDGTGYIANWKKPENDAFIVHADQKHLLRYNGLTRSGLTNNSAMIPREMTINWGSSGAQASDFDVAEVIFFNRELDLSELIRIENYLMRKYRIMKSIRAGVNVYNLYRNGEGLEHMDNMGMSCGSDGIQNSVLLRQHKKNGNPLQRRQFLGTCIGGVEGGVDSKTGSYVSLTNKSWQEGYAELMNIDCGGKGISGYVFEESNDGTKLRTNYTCHNAPINKQSCTTKEVAVNPDENRFNEALDDVNTQCEPGRAITKLLFTQEDGNYKFKFQCCNLEDQ